jgi:hypothetical protein
MANWISQKQKDILDHLSPELQKVFMENFLGDKTFPHLCGDPNEDIKISMRMLELVKAHPFWGQKNLNGKYNLICLPQACKIKKWHKDKVMAIQCGGYFCEEPFFTIVCGTGELHSLTNSYQVHGHKEKFFMMRLDKFQEKYEMQYGENARDIHGDILGVREPWYREPWSFFPDSELMVAAKDPSVDIFHMTNSS